MIKILFTEEYISIMLRLRYYRRIYFYYVTIKILQKNIFLLCYD